MGKVKNLLKYVLPPPVKAFNREINSWRHLFIQQNEAQIFYFAQKINGGGGVPLNTPN